MLHYLQHNVKKNCNLCYGAGKENRTPVFRLEICNNTIIRYPQFGVSDWTRTSIVLRHGFAIRCITNSATLTLFGTGGRSRTLSVAVLETTALPLSYTCIFGRQGGIRTHGTSRFAGLVIRCFRPLSHLSI